MSQQRIAADIVEKHNGARAANLARDYESLGERPAPRRRHRSHQGEGRRLRRRGAVMGRRHRRQFRFARFPGPGEPRDIFDKLADCAVIQQLTRATPTVSLHIPWDRADPKRLKAVAGNSASASTP